MPTIAQFMEYPKRLIRANTVICLDEYNLHITFEDKTERVINTEPYLHGPIFEPIRNDPELFKAVKVEGGVLTWPNGADIDSDVLYYGLTPAWMESETSK